MKRILGVLIAILAPYIGNAQTSPYYTKKASTWYTEENIKQYSAANMVEKCKAPSWTKEGQICELAVGGFLWGKYYGQIGRNWEPLKECAHPLMDTKDFISAFIKCYEGNCGGYSTNREFWLFTPVMEATYIYYFCRNKTD